MKFLRLATAIFGCSFTMLALADTQSPSTPNNVSATSLSSNSIRVAWNAPWDDVGVHGYNVYRDGGYYDTVFSTNYVDESVNSGSSHRYEIVAFDRAQNFSIRSNAASATTSANGSITGAITPQSNGTPATPSNLQVNALNGNRLQLQWSQADNAVGYNIYRDGNYHSTVRNSTSFEDAVDFGRDYRYSLVSFNNQEQYSARSGEAVGNTSGSSNANSAQVLNDANNNSNNNNNSGYVPDGYNLVFNEEFRNYSLDTSKWNSSYRWGPDLIINSESQYYVDVINRPDFGHSPFEFDGEHVTITAIRTPDYLRDSARQQNYLSGTLATHNKFNLRYGYIEMRAKLPRGRGLWPAFWLLHSQDHDRRPEIDIMEMLGHEPNKVYHTFHRFENGNLRSTPSFTAYGPDYSADFHTYSVRWEPGLIVWYIDGEERNRYQDGNVSWEDMYILVNLAVGGWWAGEPDGSTPLPARFTIDYIRAYQR